MQYTKNNILVTTTLVLIVAQTIVFLAVNVVWRSKRHANTLATETRVCSECVDLLTRREIATGTPEVVARLISMDNNTICCGKAGEILKLAARKNVIDKVYENLIGNVPVDALCQAEDMPDFPQASIVGVVKFSPPQTQGFHRLLWNKNNRTLTSGELTHLEEEGELFIRRAGKYFVSARLHLVSNSTAISPVDDTVTLQLSVLSHKLGYSRVVLAIKKPIGGERDWNESVQFGALFDFYEYDRPSLSVSHPSLIALNSDNDQFMATFHQA